MQWRAMYSRQWRLRAKSAGVLFVCAVLVPVIAWACLMSFEWFGPQITFWLMGRGLMSTAYGGATSSGGDWSDWREVVLVGTLLLMSGLLCCCVALAVAGPWLHREPRWARAIRDLFWALAWGAIPAVIVMLTLQIVIFELDRDPKGDWPFIVVLASLVMLPTAMLIAFRSGRHAVAGLKQRIADRWRNPQRCSRCGYDVRATPTRCPECGRLEPWQRR